MHSDDADLIDRQTTLAEIDANIVESIPIPEDVYINKGLMIARKIIEKLPTIKTDPERHGRWIMNNPYGIKCCSECGYGQRIGAENYCPNCGVGMKDGGADNDT